jgi:hypothetical protein
LIRLIYALDPRSPVGDYYKNDCYEVNQGKSKQRAVRGSCYGFDLGCNFHFVVTAFNEVGRQ